MNNKQRIADLIFNQDIPVQGYRAIVESVQGDTCTVKLFGSDLLVDDVSLIADIQIEGIRVIPSIGSVILVGCVDNQISDLFVLQYSSVDSFEVKIGETEIYGDKNTVSLKQGDSIVELSSEKILVKNNVVSLKDLFGDLVDVIQNLKVITAQGPSTSLMPDTIAALTSFKTKYPQLLQ